jgi:hypothetical protein
VGPDERTAAIDVLAADEDVLAWRAGESRRSGAARGHQGGRENESQEKELLAHARFLLRQGLAGFRESCPDGNFQDDEL